jgi:hypothetical protein
VAPSSPGGHEGAEPKVKTREAPEAAPKEAPPARHLVELLWWSAGALPRIRKRPEYKDLLAGAKPRPEDEDLDDEGTAARKLAPKDRRELCAVLTHGKVVGVEGVGAALSSGVGEDGTFAPPLALVGGDLELPFDEVETLKATVAAVTPLASTDRKIKETIESIHELFKLPWVQSAPSVLEGLTQQVRDVLGQSRTLPARSLDGHVERVLLAQRSFQKRVVLGQARLRGLLSSGGPAAPVPVYLPEALARELPGFQRMKVRVIAEVRPQLDQLEASPVALRALALARVVRRD